jgi:hypothetical protein
VQWDLPGDGALELEAIFSAHHAIDRDRGYENEMTIARLALIAVLCGVAGMPALRADDFSSYRGFQFGMSLPDALQQSGLKASDAKSLYQRPAAIQEFTWRVGSLTQTDPVQASRLSFYNGKLARIVVTYDRSKLEGMSADDMIEAISKTYGAATKPVGVEIPFHSNYGETEKVVARWEDAQYSYNLIQTGNRVSFAMVLFSKQLDGLAQAAILESIRLDAVEAPQRAIDMQKKQDAANQVGLDKARSVNKPNFRP